MCVDTMVVTAASEHKDAAHAFINYVLRPDVHASIMANIALQGAEREGHGGARSRPCSRTYPNIWRSRPAVLFQQEQLRDLGDGQKDLHPRPVTEDPRGAVGRCGVGPLSAPV